MNSLLLFLELSTSNDWFKNLPIVLHNPALPHSWINKTFQDIENIPGYTKHYWINKTFQDIENIPG